MLTLVNTGRTAQMRGEDQDRKRARINHSDDDTDEEDADDAPTPAAAATSEAQRRQAAKMKMAETWRLYLMQVPRVSERIALCIIHSYPSFRHLWLAYTDCVDDRARSALLQDLIVTHAPVNVPNARSVRIGPALSKAVYQSIWTKNEPINHTGGDSQPMEEDA